MASITLKKRALMRVVTRLSRARYRVVRLEASLIASDIEAALALIRVALLA